MYGNTDGADDVAILRKFVVLIFTHGEITLMVFTRLIF